MSEELARWEGYLIGYTEYPDPTNDMLPLGVLHAFISSTFLNGWINYVKPVKAFVIPCYKDAHITEAAVVKFNKREHVNADLSAIGDDVLLLCQDKSNRWWFFWFDQDCSDCCLGRFETEDGTDKVVAAFDAFVKDRCSEYTRGPFALDVRAINGWVKG